LYQLSEHQSFPNGTYQDGRNNPDGVEDDHLSLAAQIPSGLPTTRTVSRQPASRAALLL